MTQPPFVGALALFAALSACRGPEEVKDPHQDTGCQTESNYYLDSDGDGYGAGAAELSCSAPPGWVDNALDCDDADGAVHPGAEEVCGDLTDNDCDGVADVGAAARWHEDADGDGFGDPDVRETTCLPQDGWVLDASDCQPDDADAWPGADERCNGLDDDCDGEADEDQDQDGDGYFTGTCAAGEDCDDTNPDVWPDNPHESCHDGVDSDCDGVEPDCGFEAEIALSEADVYLYSSGANDALGKLIEVADLTGDGVPDLLATTWMASAADGGGYLIPGPLADLSAEARTEATAVEEVAYRLFGTNRVTYGAGRSIGVGDIDGDGYLDAAFGVPYNTYYTGDFIVEGPITTNRAVADAELWVSCAADYCGQGGDLGDVTGDGVADVVLGAPGDSTAADDAGAVYVLAGPITGAFATTLDALQIVETVEDSSAGRFLRIVDDIDGDGIGDLLVASPYAPGLSRSDNGRVYVLYGPPAISDFADADATLVGGAANGALGNENALASGDLDGDGYGDVAVGNYFTKSGSSAGAAWGVFGPPSGEVDLGYADLTVEGVSRGQYAGSSVAIVDADGDGLDDLLVGAAWDATLTSGGGAAYLFLAPKGGSYLTSSADTRLLGDVEEASAGSFVALVDCNDDGDADAILGAPDDATGATGAGSVFLQFASH